MSSRERGQDAQLLLENPVLKEAFEEIEKAWIQRWRSSPDTVEGYEIREQAHLALRGLDLFRDQLTSYVIDGKIAETKSNRREE